MMSCASRFDDLKNEFIAADPHLVLLEALLRAQDRVGYARNATGNLVG
jgi:hypothetical protein